MAQSDPQATQPSTAALTQTPYHLQFLEARYIRIRVLDEYINARKNEFGHQWSRKVSPARAKVREVMVVFAENLG